MHYNKSYYRTVFERKNIISEFFTMLFKGISSYPRLLLEVFIKGQFGVRYFNLASVWTIAVILFFIPQSFGMFSHSFYSSPSFSDILMENKLYYLFICAFLSMSIKRYLDIRIPWGSVDPNKFSKSFGVADPWLRNISFNGNPIEGRYREVLLEPAIFLVIGIILLTFHSLLGPLLIWCAFMYGWSFYFAYREGDNWVMDINDKRLAAIDFKETFVDGHGRTESGFEYRGARPISKDEREKIYKSTLDDDDDIAR